MSQSSDTALIERDIAALLVEQRICVIATVTPDGEPITHGMHHVSVGTKLYISSLRSTRKLLNIGRDPRVSYIVWRLPGYDNRRLASTLQMQGRATLVDGEERTRAITLMGEKEPWAKDSLLMRTNRWIRVDPVMAMWSNFSEGAEQRRIVRFSSEGHVVSAESYVKYVKSLAGEEPMAAQ